MKKLLITISTLFLSLIISLQAQQVGTWGSYSRLPWQIPAYENLQTESELAGQSLGRLFYLYHELLYPLEENLDEDHVRIKAIPHNQELLDKIKLPLANFVKELYNIENPEDYHPELIEAIVSETVSNAGDWAIFRRGSVSGIYNKSPYDLCIKSECFKLEKIIDSFEQNCSNEFLKNKGIKDTNNLQLMINRSGHDVELLNHYVNEHFDILREMQSEELINNWVTLFNDALLKGTWW